MEELEEMNMDAKLKMLGEKLAYLKNMIYSLEEANQELRCRLSEREIRCSELEKEANVLKRMLEHEICCAEKEMESLPSRKGELKGIVLEMERRETASVTLLKHMLDRFIRVRDDLKERDNRLNQLEKEKSRVDELDKMRLEAEEEARRLKSKNKELEEKNLNLQMELEVANLRNSEGKGNNWKMAAETFSLQIYGLENELKVLRSQFEYQKNMITSLEEVNRELRSQRDKNLGKLHVVGLEKEDKAAIKRLKSLNGELEAEAGTNLMKSLMQKLEKMRLEAEDLAKEKWGAESRKLREYLKAFAANDVLNSEIYQSEKKEMDSDHIHDLENELKYCKEEIMILQAQIEYQVNMIAGLEETMRSQRSENVKTSADLRESNRRLETFEGLPRMALLMLHATMERMKTGKSVDEDKMASHVLESLSSGEIKEKAVAFVEGLQGIEDVFRDKEEKIRELEKELLHHGGWLFVENQSSV